MCAIDGRGTFHLFQAISLLSIHGACLASRKVCVMHSQLPYIKATKSTEKA